MKLEACESVLSICFGTGRFIRCVLVPVLRSLGGIILVQPRGTSFSRMMTERQDDSYEIDTVCQDGTTKIDTVSISGWASLGCPADRCAIMHLAKEGRFLNLRYIGVGVTEAGITPEAQVMNDLAEFLHALMYTQIQKISIINTDNIPKNGEKIYETILQTHYVKHLGEKNVQLFADFMGQHVAFHNSMVDRITSHRDGDNLVPRAEPLPLKALVIEDLQGVLSDIPGMIIRRSKGEIEKDHMLKLRIANAIHSATVYFLALSGFPNTCDCANSQLLFQFIDLLYQYDLSIVADGDISRQDADAVYRDWVQRLKHPHFGMSCLFVCQNALQKLEIRLMPAVQDLLKQNVEPSAAMAFAFASLLCFITPTEVCSTPELTEFEGTLLAAADGAPLPKDEDVVYTAGLMANFFQKTYTFREAFKPHIPRELVSASQNSIETVITKLLEEYIGDKKTNCFYRFSKNVTSMYTAMRFEKKQPWNILNEIVATMKSIANHKRKFVEIDHAQDAIISQDGNFDIADFVQAEVMKVETVDLHTHLFPPSHGDLMLWGIDAMLTYHYLVAEFFMTATSIAPKDFFALPQIGQADLVWQALFIERSPLSEAALGVLTTLQLLGLQDLVEKRDLNAIRHWYDGHRQDLDKFVELIFTTARVRYCVMTNVPFDPIEAAHWRPHKKTFSARFRSALRVDPLLKGDWETVKAALIAAGYETSIQGAQRYLKDWAVTMKPEYFMASTPHDFELPVQHSSSEMDSDEPNGFALLEKVLIPVAEELKLPLALKLGAHRGVNPELLGGGDGVKTMDVGVLRELCSKYPKVKFLATFLSRVNQHEACVLANKFSNLHLYGCWWYCNNPSIIDEITRMRIEMLGTAFTAQHSDARVLDQLVYKWAHFRQILVKILTEQYLKLASTGWKMSKEDISRDISFLFGGSYGSFLSKSL